MQIHDLSAGDHGPTRIVNSADPDRFRNPGLFAVMEPRSPGSRPDSQSKRGTNGIAGYSLLEMLAVVTILGIVAALALPRFAETNADANRNACYANKGNIEIQVQLWYRNHHAWPATDLSDIGSDPAYFPDGLPTCPVDGSSYTIGADGSIIGHIH